MDSVKILKCEASTFADLHYSGGEEQWQIERSAIYWKSTDLWKINMEENNDLWRLVGELAALK